MDHRDHVALIREGVVGGGTVWADLGSGTGAFTLALADLLGPGGHITSVDRDGDALERQAQTLRRHFPDTWVEYRQADFARPMGLPPLDGVVMANALHFSQDKLPVLRAVRAALRPGGRLVLVEYDTDHGNAWVPYPLAFPTWQVLAGEAGFVGTRLLATRPSRFLGRIYAALSLCPPVAGDESGAATRQAGDPRTGATSHTERRSTAPGNAWNAWPPVPRMCWPGPSAGPHSGPARLNWRAAGR